MVSQPQAQAADKNNSNVQLQLIGDHHSRKIDAVEGALLSTIDFNKINTEATKHQERFQLLSTTQFLLAKQQQSKLSLLLLEQQLSSSQEKEEETCQQQQEQQTTRRCGNNTNNNCQQIPNNNNTNSRNNNNHSSTTIIPQFSSSSRKNDNNTIPAQLPFQTIPIIDLNQPLEKVSVLIGNACRHVGFFYIVNHGVPSTIIETCYALSKRFFSLPLEEKKKIAMKQSKSGIRGYFHIGEEDLNNGKDDDNDSATKKVVSGGDWKEGFDCGREVEIDELSLGCCQLIDQNQWPPELLVPGFRQGILQYQTEMLRISKLLMTCFAMALGLEDQDYFVNRTTKPMATMRLLHYPPSKQKEEEEKKSATTTTTNNKSSSKRLCGAHSDYGCCTILSQDSVGGLQVQNCAGEWIDAPIVPNSFVINIGDMMHRWTNGMFASTIHRVVTNQANHDRYSIPFFLNPNFGTLVECLETCCNSGQEKRPKLFPPATCDEILMERYKATFEHVVAN